MLTSSFIKSISDPIKSSINAVAKVSFSSSRLCFAELHFAETPKLVLGFISPN